MQKNKELIHKTRKQMVRKYEIKRGNKGDRDQIVTIKTLAGTRHFVILHGTPAGEGGG